MKVKRMGITEILKRIWLFSANKIKSSESFSKQPTQLIVELNSSLQQKLGTLESLKHNMKNCVKTRDWWLTFDELVISITVGYFQELKSSKRKKVLEANEYLSFHLFYLAVPLQGKQRSRMRDWSTTF